MIRRYISWTALSASIVLSLWLIYDGPYNYYRLWQDQAGAASHADAPPQSGSRKRAEYDVDQIVVAHLFGKTEQPAPVTVKAPETKLKLSLKGVIASEDPRFARAFIGVSKAKVKPYTVGHTIDGTDAVIRSVENGSVLLDRGGNMEVLTMKVVGIDNKSAAAPVRESTGVEAKPVALVFGDTEIRYGGIKKLNGKFNKMPL